MTGFYGFTVVACQPVNGTMQRISRIFSELAACSIRRRLSRCVYGVTNPEFCCLACESSSQINCDDGCQNPYPQRIVTKIIVTFDYCD